MVGLDAGRFPLLGNAILGVVCGGLADSQRRLCSVRFLISALFWPVPLTGGKSGDRLGSRAVVVVTGAAGG